MSYASQDLGTHEIRVVPLINNFVLMVVNGIGSLGLSLVTQEEGSCLILLSPVLLKDLLPLALTGALS